MTSTTLGNVDPSAPADAFEGRLLDQIVAARGPVGGRANTALDRFLAESSDVEMLQLWLGRESLKGTSREAVSRALARDIARLDVMLADQVNAILHHARFQQLEASWRGLWYLTGQVRQAVDMADEDGEEARIKVRVLHATKRELFDDLERALEFDQSQIFKKVYSAEFDMPGGEPYGVVLGDFAITNHPQDIELLTKLSQVAAAAFAPFIMSASPDLLGLDQFNGLEQPIQLSATFGQLQYLKWRSFRESDDARFVGLVLPRVLMRTPHKLGGLRIDGFRFREDVEGPAHEKYLWGNAVYAFGSVLVRTFAAAGWFAEIRGFERGLLGGGLVTGLCAHSFGTDARQVAVKTSTEVAVHSHQEKELGDLGFIPLCPCKETEYSVFFSNPSLHNPKKYDEPVATINSRMSSMLQYVFCVSRFAHYLKVLEREKIGGSAEASELETFLNRWVHQYVAPDERASAETKAQFPLREARVEVTPVPGKPGSHRLAMWLLPHSQLDQLSATLRLVTTIRSAKAS